MSRPVEDLAPLGLLEEQLLTPVGGRALAGTRAMRERLSDGIELRQLLRSN